MDFLYSCLPCLGPRLTGQELVLYNRDKAEEKKERVIRKAEEREERKLQKKEHAEEKALSAAEDKAERDILRKEKKEDDTRIKSEQKKMETLTGQELRDYNTALNEQRIKRETARAEQRESRAQKRNEARDLRLQKMATAREERAAALEEQRVNRSQKRDKRKERENEKRLDYAVLFVNVVRDAEPVTDEEWAYAGDVVFQKETSELPRGAAQGAHRHLDTEGMIQYLKDICEGKDVYHWHGDQTPDHVLEARVLNEMLMRKRESYLAQLAAEEEAEKAHRTSIEEGARVRALSSLSKGVKKFVGSTKAGKRGSVEEEDEIISNADDHWDT